MKQQIDIANWKRRDHFNFFNQFDEPYYGVNVFVDCTIAYQQAKLRGVSFWLYYLYQSLKAANIIEAFRLRVENDEVFLYNRVDAGSAIGRADGTFGFGDFIYYPAFDEFYPEAMEIMKQVQNEGGLKLSPAENVIRCSALPWIDFTSLSHARSFTFKDSCPKISYGKVSIGDDGTRTMPVSIHVHHALVDGIHLGEYIDCFQTLMNSVQ